MTGSRNTNGVPWYLRPLWTLLVLVILCTVWGIYGKARLAGRPSKARLARQAASPGCALALGRDLTRHSWFHYCTRRSLSPDYFRRAAAALSDGYVYLAFARSNSPAGQVIGLFTERPYNHVSLALDRDLTTLVSYNGGGPGAAPGLNPETLAELVHRQGACVRLYRLPATRDQKRIILRRLGKIDQEGSAYNLLGLVLPYAPQPNTMFCSQFVYGILKLAGLAYFQKDPQQVRPTDLLEWDLQGRLEFLREYTHEAAPARACSPALPMAYSSTERAV